MAAYATQFAPFAHWPDDKDQTPREMATAGWFYQGRVDYTQCFHCGGVLQGWRPRNIAWSEHARWYPQCHYLIASMGQSFVDDVQIFNR